MKQWHGRRFFSKKRVEKKLFNNTTDDNNEKEETSSTRTHYTFLLTSYMETRKHLLPLYNQENEFCLQSVESIWEYKKSNPRPITKTHYTFY
jgi:hypothetical protein